MKRYHTRKQLKKNHIVHKKSGMKAIKMMNECLSDAREFNVTNDTIIILGMVSSIADILLANENRRGDKVW